MKKLFYLLVFCGLAYTIFTHLPDDTRRSLVSALPEGIGRLVGQPEAASSPTEEGAPGDQEKTGPKEGDLDPATGRPLVKCYQCGGTGSVKCSNPRCKHGWVDCPGPCLKLSSPGWHHMEVAGHGPDELWQTFHGRNGKRGMSWNQHHVGEVIEYHDGQPQNMGACKICGGRAKVACTVCNNTGKLTCPLCGGKGLIPARPHVHAAPTPPIPGKVVSAAAQSAPQPIAFKNGTTLMGKIVVEDGDKVTIRTATGETMQVSASSIVRPAASPAAH